MTPRDRNFRRAPRHPSSPRSDAPRRRSLSQVRGRPRETGDPVLAMKLSAAWHAANANDGRTLTHGFHPWPARAHPATMGTVIDALCPRGGAVLDPFAGSGTVVVEALARGRRGLGFDIHPLAVRIIRAKIAGLDREERRLLEQAAANVARRARRGDDAEVEADEEVRGWFDEEVWWELCALAGGIQQQSNATRRFLLEMVLSSLLIKLSRRAAETDPRRTQGARPGAAAKLFIDRTTELCLGMSALAKAAYQSPAASVSFADARALPLPNASVDLVVTSPPYLGTYDYAGMQDLRGRLLGLDLRGAERREIGGRTKTADTGDAGRREYVADLTTVLREMRRVAKPDATAVILIGDSTHDGRMVDAAELLRQAATAAGLAMVAASSQPRPATVRGTEREVRSKGRFEHLIALRSK